MKNYFIIFTCHYFIFLSKAYTYTHIYTVFCIRHIYTVFCSTVKFFEIETSSPKPPSKKGEKFKNQPLQIQYIYIYIYVA